MTELLKKAFIEACKLSAQEQDALAAFMLSQLESEPRWSDAFSKSQDTLAALAEEATAVAHMRTRRIHLASAIWKTQ